MSVKTERIASSIEKELNIILNRESKDKIFSFVTITHVDLAPDLSSAKVYFNCLDLDKKEEVLNALKRANGFLKSSLAGSLELRSIPNLFFVFDKSIEYGEKIESIIDSLKEEK